MKNPHNWLTNVGDDLWECMYCKTQGSFDEMNEPDAKAIGIEYVPCTYEYPPCDSCGQTPTCAPDCKGVVAAIAGLNSNEKIHVAGKHLH